MDIPPIRFVGAGFKSLFQKSPLKNRAAHGATIYDMAQNVIPNLVIPVKTGISVAKASRQDSKD